MKRLIDVVFSFLAVVLLLPGMLFISMAILISMGRPMLFRQLRPGKNGKPFYLYKFRTMLDLKDDKGNYLPDEKRLTTFGRFLRKYSLDELPELWNVIKGEMSLVGPRPLLIKYLPYFSENEKLRFKMKPGITGWAQVNGRNRASWEERLSLDIWYVNNWSTLLDINIMAKTIINIITHKDLVILPKSYMLDLDEERKAARL